MEQLPTPIARALDPLNRGGGVRPPTPPATKATTPKMGTIYFIMRDCRRRAVKIGWSAFPEERRRRLQTSCPESLTIVHQMPGTVAEERAIHRRFAALRLRGEWFRMKGELAELVGLPQYK